MAITAALCSSYKQELLQGTHTAADVYKLALYTSAATLSAATTVYTTTGEVVGTGYTAGGEILAGFATNLVGTIAFIDFTDPTWPASTIAADGAIIYNSSKGNAVCAVLNFGSTITSTADLFTVQMPVADAANAIIRLA